MGLDLLNAFVVRFVYCFGVESVVKLSLVVILLKLKVHLKVADVVRLVLLNFIDAVSKVVLRQDFLQRR